MSHASDGEDSWEQLAGVAEHQLIELTRTIRDLNLGTPGVHGPNRGPSLNQLPMSTKRRVQQVVAANRYATPAVFGQLLANLSQTPEQTLEWLNEYTREYVNWHFYNCVSLLHRALMTRQEWRCSWFDFEAESHTRIRARGFTVRGPAARAADDGHELLSAQRQMMPSRSFGWVIDARSGMQVTAPSHPVCELMGMPYGELAGSYLLDDPVRGRLMEMLANFGEWVLVVGMLTRSQCWASHPDQARLEERAERFFDWLARYVRQNHRDLARQVDQVPDRLIDGQSTRQDLEQCLEAAVGRARWPTYSLTAWNRLRMCVRKHPLLPTGQTARFVTLVLPIPHSDNPVGYEVTWYEEHADEVANGLMRRILQRMGLS